MNTTVLEIEVPRPYEVVVVEDSKTDAQLILRALSLNGQQVHLTLLTDGEKASAYLHELSMENDLPFGKPDLVLLDLNLPRKDGFEVLGDLKSERSLFGVPIVVFTSTDHPIEIRRCYEMGANCVTTKPLELDPFMATVRAIGHYWLNVLGSKR